MGTIKWACSILCLAVLGLFGCKQGEGGKCGKAEDCGTGLTCGPKSTCVTPKAAECQKSCGENGKCEVQDDECVATRDEDCKKANCCGLDGLCTAKDGKCVAAGRDCKKSIACKLNQQCTVKDDRCVTAADGASDSTGATSKVCEDYFAANKKCREKIQAAAPDQAKSMGDQDKMWRDMLKDPASVAAAEAGCGASLDALKNNPACK